MTQEVFTLWVGDTLYGMEISQVLCIRCDFDQIISVPVRKPGLLGVSPYQGQPSPVFDLAGFMGVESHKDSRNNLAETLVQREKDHEDWLNALEHSVKDGVPFLKAKDPHQCAFGKWYDQFKTRDQLLQEILDKFDAPHKYIHSLAETLLGLRSQGKVDEALEIIVLERVKTLGRLKRLFQQARSRIKESIRPVIIYVTHDGCTPKLALVVDEVNDVVTYLEEDVFPVEKSNLSHIGVDEMKASLLKCYVKSQKDDYFILDPFKILDQHGDVQIDHPG